MSLSGGENPYSPFTLAIPQTANMSATGYIDDVVVPNGSEEEPTINASVKALEHVTGTSRRSINSAWRRHG